MSPALPGLEVLPPMEPNSQPRPAQSPRMAPASRWRIFNEFVDQAAKHLTPVQAMAWIVLFRDSREGVASVSQAYIATRLGVSIKTVKRSIKVLRKTGLVEIVHQGGLNRGLNQYRVRSMPEGRS